MNSYNSIEEIVLIDDDPIQHLICQRMLQSLKIQIPIKNCYNGLEAISYLKEINNRPFPSRKRLIFLDLNMPVMDGFEFLENYCALNNHGKANDHLIVLSSTVLRSDRLIAVDFSVMQGFYAKPLKLETLKIILNELESS